MGLPTATRLILLLLNSHCDSALMADACLGCRAEVAEMTSAGLRLHEGLHDHNHPQQDSKQVLDRQIEVSPEK